MRKWLAKYSACSPASITASLTSKPLESLKMFENEEYSPVTTHDDSTLQSLNLNKLHFKSENEVIGELLKLGKNSDNQLSEMNCLNKQFKEFLSERDGSNRILMNKVSEAFSCINTKADQKEVVALKRELFQVEILLIWY